MRYALVSLGVTEDLGRLLAGRYRLSGLLGQGGMGAVWRALDEQLDREVAVKELRLPEQLPVAQREAWIARLDREARAAARLKHPGIITVHDRIVGDDGRPWIVMELVHGPSLDELIRAHGPMPVPQVAAIGLQILAALDAAHRAGITHRDIKPANVLLEGDRVVVTDFGIAALEGDPTLTASGVLLGTPAFMSPEQVRGQPATPASDLWSLGATLYTAVEGRPPFGGGSTGGIFVAVATEEPARPGQAGPLEPLLAGLLRKNPAERPTADQVRTMLAGHPAPGRTTIGRPPSPPQPHQPIPGPMGGGPPGPRGVGQGPLGVGQGPLGVGQGPLGVGQGPLGVGQGPLGGQTGLGAPAGHPARNRRGPAWPGLAVAAAAALLVVAVLLPWVAVTAHLTAVAPAGLSHRLDRSVNGLGMGWGWLTLAGALGAGALGVTGGIRRNGRLTAAAAIPALIALGSVAVARFQLNSAERPTLRRAATFPPALDANIRAHLTVASQLGWFLALLLALSVIALAGVALATVNKT